MFKYLNGKRNKGQSTLEYAVLIIIIIGALLSIQVYIKRGIQGRLKSATDDIGDQFSPGNTYVNKTKTTSGRELQSSTQISGSRTQLLNEEITRENMNSTIANAQEEYWGGNAQ